MRTAPLLLAACSSVPVQPVDADDVELVEEAVADIGYGVDWTPSGIEVELVEQLEGPHVGEAFVGVCRRRIVSVRDPVVLRHELGHALGLEHHPDPANLMHERVASDTTRITARQHQRTDAEAAFLRACPRTP